MAVTVDLETVRVLVGDADPAAELITDDQLALIVDGYGSTRLAAAAVADSIAALFSRKVSFSLEGLRIENSSKAANYRALADRLRLEAENEPGQMGFSVLGVSVAAVEAADADDDRVPSKFEIGMQQDPQVRGKR